jgi:hypothetical protein
MMKVTVTTPLSIEKFGTALQKAMQTGLRDLANDAFKFWNDEAGRNLRSTLRDYRDALDMKKVDENTYEIKLQHSDAKKNFLVTAIEVGVDGYDLKKGLLASPSAKVWSQHSKLAPGGKKPGVFLDVPIRENAKTQNKPNRYIRLTAASAGWKHPGFRPQGAGKRDLSTPYRDKVKEHLEEQVPKVLGPLISRMAI